MYVSEEAVAHLQVSLAQMSEVLVVSQHAKPEVRELIEDAQIFSFMRSSTMVKRVIESLIDENLQSDDDDDYLYDWTEMIQFLNEKGIM